MSANLVVMEGTVKPNGELELVGKVSLPPGKVQVTVQAMPELPEGDPFFDMLRRIWAERAQAGLTPRPVEEIEAQRKRLREQSQEEIEEAGRLQDESRKLDEQAGALKRGNP